MKKFFGIFSLILFASIGFSQDKCKIKKAYAFYGTSSPGTQMQGEDGNPVPVKVTVNRFIYIEWRGKKKPEITTVLYDGKSFEVTISEEEGDTAKLGPNYTNNPDFKVTAKKCNSLWKLSLPAAFTDEAPDLNCTNIVIGDGEGGCSFSLNRETPLMTMPRY